MCPPDVVGGSADRLELAVVQLNSRDDVAQNLETCRKLVLAAAARGARVVVLPENFAYFGPEAGRRKHAERLGDEAAPIQRALSEMARAASCYVVGGGLPESSSDPERPFNSALVLGPEGKLLGGYHKIHLFDVDLGDGTSLRESASTSAGDAAQVVDLAGFKVGLSICYDLRFPELYRRLVRAGAEVLLVPSAFTLHTGKDHWHVLLRARAIEAQCYVAAAAQWGKHPQGRTSYGHSLIADPWGTVIADCSDGVGFAIGSVERSQLERVRQSLPSLTHIRL
ncbi:MAG TPA: carbon-nitrogen hydrolase family protein [Polyangiaceae bacterium]|nr:carbon-nitrogen hydrolase family protein [Polyangiaceae bacterium]